MRPQEIVERALGLSRTEGCVVIVSETHQANLRWARNTLTTNGEMVGTAVTVLAFAATSTGMASGSVTRSAPADVAELAALVGAAEDAARDGGDAEDAEPLVAGTPASADWEEPAVPTSGGVFAAVAPALGEVFAAAAGGGGGAGAAGGDRPGAGGVDRPDAAATEHFGYAEHQVTTVWLGTSTGLRLRHVQPEGRLELTAKSHERSRSAWTGVATRDFHDVDVVALDARLRQGLAWQARRVEVAPGRHDALLSPSAVSDLMIELYWTAIARDAAEGRSVFSRAGGGTRVGEAVAVSRLSLVSDPMLPGLESPPFEMASASSSASSVFDNGLPLHRTAWIDSGRLAALIGSRHAAAEAGVAVTPAIGNLVLTVEGAVGSMEELVARTEHGLLVTCLWYNRVVDPQTMLTTGLTRDGVYVVEGGEVVGAAGNFRFNESPVDVLSRVLDAGATVPTLAREMGDYVNRAAMPPLRVGGYNFSTASDAL